jgi:transposase-like protein
MSKRSFPIEIKLEAIQAYKDGKYSMKEIISRYKVSNESVRNWVYLYDKHGIENLNESSGWKRYTKELKLDAIQDYLSGEYSLIMSQEVSGSRFPVGSSAIINLGLFTKARAIAILCCSPPDNSFG